MKRLGGSIGVMLLVLSAGCGDSTPEKTARHKTPGGVEYEIVTEGKGREATQGDTVQVHYTGRLAENGNKFDSSYDHPGKKPFRFRLGAGKVIRGWEEGVAGMKVGEKRTLHIPSRLAYGPSGSGPIPPNANLVFDVELVAIEDGKGPPSEMDDD